MRRPIPRTPDSFSQDRTMGTFDYGRLVQAKNWALWRAESAHPRNTGTGCERGGRRIKRLDALSGTFITSICLEDRLIGDCLIGNTVCPWPSRKRLISSGQCSMLVRSKKSGGESIPVLERANQKQRGKRLWWSSRHNCGIFILSMRSYILSRDVIVSHPETDIVSWLCLIQSTKKARCIT